MCGRGSEIVTPTRHKYKAERTLRGTQAEVAKALNVRRQTVGDRETGAQVITQEAWLALLAVPKTNNQKDK